MLDPIARFALRHETALSVAAGLWFAISCAAMARFIDLPEIPFVTDRNAWIFSGAYNALWWAAARPALERRKAALAGTDGGQARIPDASEQKDTRT